MSSTTWFNLWCPVDQRRSLDIVNFALAQHARASCLISLVLCCRDVRGGNQHLRHLAHKSCDPIDSLRKARRNKMRKLLTRDDQSCHNYFTGARNNKLSLIRQRQLLCTLCSQPLRHWMSLWVKEVGAQQITRIVRKSVFTRIGYMYYFWIFPIYL